ncbi:MAG: hypothetical protein CL833_00190 [Crocinitomicaceae bacterium]|nr:hypothetical protein [Crocinitomicaceae bacterium]
MVSNPGYFSQMATGGSLTQIEDGVDNPHTGLIKALSLGVAGNYVISGFDASSVTATSATIAAGVVLRDGKRVAISGSGVSLSATYTTGYHLLVARSSALTVINPTAADKVPAFTAGDVPIAILAHTGSNPMQIQYFGTGKKENSLSVAYDNSGYTEAGALTGDANGITMTGLYKLDTLPTATVATDDKVIIQDTNDSDKVKTVTAQAIADLRTVPASPAIEDNSGTPVLASGITETEVRSLLNVEDSDFVNAVEAESSLDLTGDVTIGNKKLIVDTTTLVVNAPSYTNKVGIGTATPSNTLDVNGDVSGDKFLVETVQYELEILANAGATPGPPTPAFSLSDTDTIYRVSTVAGTPAGTGNIDLSLPATASNIGVVFKLIVTSLDGASPLTIGPNSGDNIVSETLSVLAASGATHTISSAGVYELVCFSGSWMLYKTV